MGSYKSLAVYFLLLMISFISMSSSSSTLNMITPSQPMRDNHNETLLSVGGIFEAGFFTPENSASRYLGIWYKNITEKTIVWVANRERPLSDSSGVLQIDSDTGILGIFDSSGREIWSSKTSKNSEKPILQLLDSGNLVLRKDNNSEGILWQSFDYPGDTFLPGMTIGSNLRTGEHKVITSWKTLHDPTPGDYSMKMDTKGLPQLVITQGSSVKYRVGSWDGLCLTGTPELSTMKSIKLLYEQSEDGVFYGYKLRNTSILMRCTLFPEGYSMFSTWSPSTNKWDYFTPNNYDMCYNYDLCGANSNCNAANGTQHCECLSGFSIDKIRGCTRTTPLGCHKGDGFLRYEGMKLPDTSSSWYDKTINLRECEKRCLRNCSCMAYSSLNISEGGSGCLHWFDNIVDLRQLPEGGQDFYIRVSAGINRSFDKKQLSGIVIGCAVFMLVTAVLGLTIYLQKNKLMLPGIKSYRSDTRDTEDIDLPIFDFFTIYNATNQFSESNKLGQGGFGPVYKGILVDGQEIAVKRLSKTSGQGIDEFQNEVLLIAKLQHRNLVKLLGFCIRQDEKLLIYEFMTNKSLDYFIFDSKKRKLLDWSKRFQIVDGIARGLLYLHQDSRLKIIHRDLKTSNILLDNNMNPKISDFGLARTFGGDQVEANTNKVMGTYGYMPPEYALHGSFSVKSDVFSFGVIILEIISGKKNREFSDPHHHLNLLGHAWRLWIEERPMELIDELLHDSTNNTYDDVLRCIQVGLLCVQQRPENRPDMSTVVLMLNGEKSLPKPSQPGFYTGSENQPQTNFTTRRSEEGSINEVSISLLEER